MHLVAYQASDNLATYVIETAFDRGLRFIAKECLCTQSPPKNAIVLRSVFAAADWEAKSSLQVVIPYDQTAADAAIDRYQKALYAYYDHPESNPKPVLDSDPGELVDDAVDKAVELLRQVLEQPVPVFWHDAPLRDRQETRATRNALEIHWGLYR